MFKFAVRKPSRVFARQIWIDSGYDHDIACAIARRRIVRRREDPGEFGSVLLVLMFTSAILQICYTLFRFWRDTQTKIPPELAAKGEPG